MDAAKVFWQEVDRIQKLRDCDRPTAWAVAKVASASLYAAMENEELQRIPANMVALENAPTNQSGAIRQMGRKGIAALENGSDGFNAAAGARDAMIPAWAYKLMGVTGETLAELGNALALKEFPADRAGALLHAAATWLMEKEGFARVDAFIKAGELLPALHAQELARQRGGVNTGKNLGAPKAGVPTTETADDNRSDFVVSLMPSWTLDALGMSPETTDLTLKSRMESGSLKLTPSQAQRTVAAMTDALVTRQKIPRAAASLKLRQRAYYLFKIAEFR